VTERKRAEAALSKVSQRLIEAQEQERSRLARELHDDISQQLALLAVNLEGMKLGLPASAANLLAKHIDDARGRVADLSKDIQALSHRLHSPKLELLGLAATAASFCQEFSALQKVQIDFHSEKVPKGLPREISLCLFRVLQEALQNAAKHSGSKHFQVLLACETNQIDLTVHDGGVGFQPEEAFQGRGLGLTSMKERLKLVEGELQINSRLHEGTTLRARVPISSKKMHAGAGK
jgi:signal transduction histidine kinase